MEKRGLTPVVTTVLLLMLAIVIFGGLFVWFGRLQSKSQTESERMYSQQISSLSINYRILSVYEDPQTSRTLIVLKNTGQDAISGTAFSNTIIKIDSVLQQFNVSNMQVSPGQVVYLLSNSYPFNNLTDGKVHVIQVDIGGRQDAVTCGPLSPGSDNCGI